MDVSMAFHSRATTFLTQPAWRLRLLERMILARALLAFSNQDRLLHLQCSLVQTSGPRKRSSEPGDLEILARQLRQSGLISLHKNAHIDSFPISRSEPAPQRGFPGREASSPHPFMARPEAPRDRRARQRHVRTLSGRCTPPDATSRKLRHSTATASTIAPVWLYLLKKQGLKFTRKKRTDGGTHRHARWGCGASFHSMLSYCFAAV